MTNPPPDKFLAPDFSIDGIHLVHASAGTGKTYSIQSLYLRLVVEANLPVRNILVVTFTEAATRELRERLRRILQYAANMLDGHAAPDEDELRERRQRIEPLVALVGPQEAARRIRLALLDFDLAAISTIHGFCHRTLSRFAFETGQFFDLTVDNHPVIDALGRDWWRRNLYGAAPGQAGFLHAGGVSLPLLTKLAGKKIARPDARLMPRPFSLARLGEDLTARHRRVRKSLSMLLDLPEREAKGALAGRAEARRLREELVELAPLLDRADPYPAALVALRAASRCRDGSTLHQAVGRLPGGSGLLEYLAAVRLLPLAVITRGAAEIEEEYRRSRSGRTVVSYDDMLLNLRQALDDGPRGDRLRQYLRQEYRAALIDEFQDTDPVQYEIFRKIFVAAPRPLPCFYVGDPKQAIYRFRGGDIHTYLRATAEIAPSNIHRLDCNYRSERQLVRAFNLVFADAGGDGDRGERTFRHHQIACDGRLMARGKPPAQSLTVNGRPDPAPCKLWYYRQTGSRRVLPGRNSPFARAVYADTAGEIRHLLDDKSLLVAGRRVNPGHIAVLVMTHDEASHMAAELEMAGVPCVRYGVEPVFDTAEAADLAILLSALSRPRDSSLLRAAMAGRLLGLSEAAVIALNDGLKQPLPEGWADPARDLAWSMEDWMCWFARLRELWRGHGFAAAMARLEEDSGLKARLAAEPRGERALTNFRHLVELAHRAAQSRRLSMEGVISWLARQLNEDTREQSEEIELRPETDREAVKVMTVFKSKGLQFPIVFAPTLWRRSPSPARDEIVVFHDADDNNRTVMSLDTAVHRNQAEAEALDEDVRLFYVALTRAIHRVYLVGGDFKTTRTTAMTWLASRGGLRRAIESAGGPAADGLPICLTLREPCGQGRRPAEQKGLRPVEADNRPAAAGPLASRKMPVINQACGHGSFSSLARRPSGPADLPVPYDFDAGDEQESSPDDLEAAAIPPVFLFPAGARTGECWHRIMQRLSFSAGEREIREVAGQELENFALVRPEDKDRRRTLEETITGMVSKLLEAPLPPLVAGASPFRLRDIAEADRIDEFSFAFPASRARMTGEIAGVLARHWATDPARRVFLDPVAGWNRPVPGGFLTGFIDLVFRRRDNPDRYYIVDWKSNRLRGKPDDFSPAGLAGEMASHFYFLQYLLYSVALHQFLRNRLAGYDYRQNFGGIYYLFLRGAGDMPHRGIFHDRPAMQLIEDLSGVMGDFS